MTEKEKDRLEKEFNEKYADYVKHIEEKNFLRSKKMEIRRLKKEGNKSIGLTTSKLFSYYLFILFNIVLIYALIAMWHFGDLTYLGVIITDILAQILVFAIYSFKAFKDTQSEEAIKLEREKLNSLPDKTRNELNKLLDSAESLGIKTRDGHMEFIDFDVDYERDAEDDNRN